METNLKLLKQSATQTARTAYASTFFAAFNETFLLFSNRNLQKVESELNNIDRFAHLSFNSLISTITTFTATITTLILTIIADYFFPSIAANFFFNLELFGFLMTQAFFMRDFINKLYDKNLPKNNPWGLTLIITGLIYLLQFESFYLLLTLMAINKLAFTLANPRLQYLPPCAHEQESQMHFFTALFIQSIRQQEWLGKTVNFTRNALSNFSIAGLIMWLLSVSAKTSGDQKNNFIGPFALTTNALCIFMIKKSLPHFNKNSETLNDTQLRLLYLISFFISTLSFCLVSSYLDNVVRQASILCMPSSWNRSELFTFILDECSLNSNLTIYFNATLAWRNLPTLHSYPSNSTALISWQDSSYSETSITSNFGFFSGEYADIHCGSYRAHPAPQ